MPTCGDWHQSALQWEKPTVRESKDSFFGSYGIEDCSHVPEWPGTHKTANHIRALLDLLADGHFAVAQGMRKDYICNDELDSEVFAKVYEMHSLPSWQKIKSFMGKEYGMRWVRFLRAKGEEYGNAE